MSSNNVIYLQICISVTSHLLFYKKYTFSNNNCGWMPCAWIQTTENSKKKYLPEKLKNTRHDSYSTNRRIKLCTSKFIGCGLRFVIQYKSPKFGICQTLAIQNFEFYIICSLFVQKKPRTPYPFPSLCELFTWGKHLKYY